MGLSALLQSCTPSKYLQVAAEENTLKIPRKDLVSVKSHKPLRNVMIKTPALGFPIVLYRFSETEFSALLLQCTHQSVELSVNGDLLSCSGHGSEFTNRGEIVQGPADQKLKSFPVTSDANNVYIKLV